jgi:hypothetical protein
VVAIRLRSKHYARAGSADTTFAALFFVFLKKALAQLSRQHFRGRQGPGEQADGQVYQEAHRTENRETEWPQALAVRPEMG